jgi:4-amino-4-deoxy-L-arabinose transferase-like glycosyltransferase
MTTESKAKSRHRGHAGGAGGGDRAAHAPNAAPRGWARLVPPLTGYPAAAAVVTVYWLLAVTSVLDKSLTMDETVHVPAGYSYWKYNDYRMDPENGNLPQRWMAIPLLVGDTHFPDRDGQAWKESNEWHVGLNFFFREDNDLRSLMLRSRAMNALLGVALGLLVYAVSRGLFGPVGGMISLLLFAFDPTLLANGRLGTSDMAATLFFILSAWTLWRVLDRLTPLRLAASCLAMAGLFLAKMSGVLAVPIALILVVVRLARGGSWEMRISGKVLPVVGRLRQALAACALAAVHAAAVFAIIWAAYGFRYSVFNPADSAEARLPDTWEEVTKDQGSVSRCLLWARDARLLPEGYLYGFAYVHHNAQKRRAFLMGDYSGIGWWLFFPVCMAIKTPLPTFGVLGLGLVALSGAALRRGSRSRLARLGEGLYLAGPLLAVIVVYGAISLTSRLNIGHRHIMPIYPPLFVLAGAAGMMLRYKANWPRIAVGVLLGALAVGNLWIWPDYLAFFNMAIGGPKNGYKYLIDSSLDWGQDAPKLAEWIDRNVPPGQRVYVSYFGNNLMSRYGVRDDAVRLPGCPEWDRQVLPHTFELGGGVYCISATCLQTVLMKPWGPWRQAYERAYLLLKSRLPEVAGNPGLAAEFSSSVGLEPGQNLEALFDELRFARLAAYLRKRSPDDYIGYSILVYRLTGAEAREAVDGPPPEIRQMPDIYSRHWQRP